MNTQIKSLVFICTFFVTIQAQAAPLEAVLADTALLLEAGLPILEKDDSIGVAFTWLTEQQKEKLSHLAHRYGRCGGYESLEIRNEFSSSSPLDQLRRAVRKSEVASSFLFAPRPTQKDPNVDLALAEIKDTEIRTWVEFLTSFETRYNRGQAPNEHVNALKAKLDILVQSAAYPVTVDLISHRRTSQKTIRVRIEGSTRPNEIIVLGGHLDSINQAQLIFGDIAPGADDNASGSADLLEALRVLLKQPRPQRSIEFFWYAGEESGLLGSGEIAEDYKKQSKDVVAVLQLDMTMYAGDGEFALASMSDFTSPWLRKYLVDMNRIYLGAKIYDDRCGYGCSDHASWFKQGFPTLMPFEASMRSMNPDIHTDSDVINSRSNFKHSALFARIALLMAMDLGNSTAREN